MSTLAPARSVVRLALEQALTIAQEMLRFLVFDILVLDSELLTSKPLGSRYGRLKAWVIGPHLALLNQRPHLRQRLPFESVVHH